MGDALPPPLLGGHERTPGIADASPRIDGLAYAAVVTGILSLVFSVILIGLPGLPGLPGLLLGLGAAIMGFISRRRVAASPGTLGGGGVALAGLILGIIGIGASVAIFMFAFWVVGLFQCGPAGSQSHAPGCP